MILTIYVGTELFFFSQPKFISLLSCLHAASRSVTNSLSLSVQPVFFSRAPGSVRTQNPLCPAVINHAYFCAQSGLQVGVLVTMCSSRVKALSGERSQTEPNPVASFPRARERRRDEGLCDDPCCMSRQCFRRLKLQKKKVKEQKKTQKNDCQR